MMTFEELLLRKLKKLGYIFLVIFIIICVDIAFLWFLECFTENRYVYFVGGFVLSFIVRVINNAKFEMEAEE